jgi:hypothetical protein
MIGFSWIRATTWLRNAHVQAWRSSIDRPPEFSRSSTGRRSAGRGDTVSMKWFASARPSAKISEAVEPLGRAKW